MKSRFLFRQKYGFQCFCRHGSAVTTQSEEQSSGSVVFKKGLDPLRHDRVRTEKVHEEHEETTCLTAVLDIVLDVDLLIEVLTHDKGQHRLHSADPNELLGHTVTAVLTASGKGG